MVGSPHREALSRPIHRFKIAKLGPGKKNIQQHLIGRSTVPDSWEVLTHHHHILRKIDTARTQSKTRMVAHLGGAPGDTPHVCILILKI